MILPLLFKINGGGAKYLGIGGYTRYFISFFIFIYLSINATYNYTDYSTRSTEQNNNTNTKLPNMHKGITLHDCI